MVETNWGEDTRPEATFSDFVALLKPRVMSLVIFTAAIGMFVSPVGVHPVIAFACILCIAVGAGASGALNMWWDADIDAKMARTARRPIPSGRVTPQEALGFGLALSILSVLTLAVFANFLAAALLAFTIFFYAVIYSMWLKRSTPQNIVIGGAAGAFPPMIGWAVASGGVALEPVLMFGVIFMWTPPHFWALALFMKDDYHRAGVPMMTVVAGHDRTRRLILLYTFLLTPVAILPAFTSIGGPLYLIVALGLGGWFLKGALAIAFRSSEDAHDDGFASEKAFFKFSILYLFAHFLTLGVEAIIRAFGGWPGQWWSIL